MNIAKARFECDISLDSIVQNHIGHLMMFTQNSENEGLIFFKGPF